MNKIYIYNKETLELLGVPFITTLEEFKEKPTEFYPDWDNRSMIIAETEVQYPIIDKTGILRDKTREERILLDNKTDLLEDGEYIENGKIIFIEYDESLGYLKKVWDKETHTWKEGATQEEIKNFYFSQINKFKAEILEIGFLYIDKNGKPHQQKCREKDLSLLGNAIAAGEDAVAYSKKMKIVWSFNDGDILEMSLEDLKLLRIYGAVFVQTIFTVEAELKATEPNILLKKQNFIDKINELSEVKCYKKTL